MEKEVIPIKTITLKSEEEDKEVDGIEFDIAEGGSVVAVRFPARLALAESDKPEVSFVTNKFVERDIVYMKLKKKPNQEYSVDVSEFDGQVIIDFDCDDRAVGIAFLELSLLPADFCQSITKKMKTLPPAYAQFITSASASDADSGAVDPSGDDASASASGGVRRRVRPPKDRSPFLLACCAGDLDELNRLYEAELRGDGEEGAGGDEDVHNRARVARELLMERDRQGSNAFLLAASYGQIEVARWLCAKFRHTMEGGTNWNGANSNDDNHNSACHFYHYLDQPRNDGQNACMQAASHGHTPFLAFLLSEECGFPLSCVNSCDGSGDTVIMVAAANGYLETAEWLHVRGADISRSSKSRSNCLHRAAVGGHVNMLAWLVEKGMDVNSVTEKGLTALHYAVKNDRLDATAYLLSQSALILADAKVQTPVDLAKLAGKTPMLDLLASKGLI